VHDKRGQEIELPASFDELMQVVSEALGIECVELWSDKIGTTLMTISSVRNKARRGEFIFGACSKDIDDLFTSTEH
jgi:hypothetical protein